MKSSENIAQSLYSFLAFYMALSMLAAYVIILETMTAVDLHAFTCIAYGALSALAASIYSGFMKNIKSEKTSGNIRGGILIAAAVYIFSSIFLREFQLIERFLPNHVNIFSSVCALYTWINIISYRQLFNSRLQFNAVTENFNGEKLREKLVEDTSLLFYTNENINKAQFNYFFQVVIICVLALICAIFKIHLSTALRFLLIFILAAGVFIHALFQIIKWEQYYAGEGITLNAASRSKRLLAVITLTLSALVLAFLAASDKSIIPFSLITGFFTWFFSLFQFPSASFEPAGSNEITPNISQMHDFSGIGETPSSPVWELITKYGYMALKYGLILLAAGLFIRFMISPLLNRGKADIKTSFLNKLKRIIIDWHTGMLNAISSFFLQLKNEKIKKLNKINAEDISRAAELIYNAYTPAKRKDVKQSVTLFARLIVWGSEARNVIWKPSFAPGEYCAILASSKNKEEDSNHEIQIQNEGILRCGEIFEKSLYSAEVLSVSEKNEFRELVEGITSVEVS
ncbi:MAG: hypothetical protein FWC19_03165 [Treponema sp.]|nr:hypothetical protein [Treponema sp.]MCL2271790.1 hypothetical protein [Treponema sp.]